MSSKGIPILMYGRGVQMANGISAVLAPKYDMIHFCLNAETAQSEFKAVLNGDLVTPSSGAGSNKDRQPAERKSPVAIAIGGGIPEEEVEALKGLLGPEKSNSIKWTKVTPAEGQAAGGPQPENIGPLVMKKLDEALGE
ncbi:hypothetical protein K402DRAFT_462928 [Aulographum hederae CBS 113979]|uniref:Uncharacterized protein n=1 Tax=Aulographum hederae CBS 113979 TaxID=1176131 RepID=A0A6G1H1X0_9PEZI|nr:hypothetical protein K402DRAFT_462928 [Aulographum hederae CBS 113979]